MPSPSARRVVWAATAALIVSVAIAGAASCRRTASPEPGAKAPAADKRSAADHAPLFPLDVGAPDPRVQRLCDALYTLPEARKAQCCATAPGSGLAGECVRTLTAAVHDGAIVLDAAKVERCVQDASAAYQGCEWVTPLAPATPASCVGFVQGRLQAGAACRSSLECADGLACRGARPTTAGVCAAPGSVGAACGAGPDTLAIYLKDAHYQDQHPECQGFCRGGRCVDFLGSGGACSSDLQCGPGRRCDSGKCVGTPPAKIGEACTGNACEPGARCAGGRCIPLKKNGETCSSPFDCLASCVAAPGAIAGVCGPLCVASPNMLPLPTQPR
jgi:hypothetical protein